MGLSHTARQTNEYSHWIKCRANIQELKIGTGDRYGNIIRLLKKKLWQARKISGTERWIDGGGVESERQSNSSGSVCLQR